MPTYRIVTAENHQYTRYTYLVEARTGMEAQWAVAGGNVPIHRTETDVEDDNAQLEWISIEEVKDANS